MHVAEIVPPAGRGLQLQVGRATQKGDQLQKTVAREKTILLCPVRSANQADFPQCLNHSVESRYLPTGDCTQDKVANAHALTRKFFVILSLLSR